MFNTCFFKLGYENKKGHGLLRIKSPLKKSCMVNICHCILLDVVFLLSLKKYAVTVGAHLQKVSQSKISI